MPDAVVVIATKIRMRKVLVRHQWMVMLRPAPRGQDLKGVPNSEKNKCMIRGYALSEGINDNHTRIEAYHHKAHLKKGQGIRE